MKYLLLLLCILLTSCEGVTHYNDRWALVCQNNAGQQTYRSGAEASWVFHRYEDLWEANRSNAQYQMRSGERCYTERYIEPVEKEVKQ